MSLSARSWRFISYARSPRRPSPRIWAGPPRCWSPSSHPPAGPGLASPLRDISHEFSRGYRREGEPVLSGRLGFVADPYHGLAADYDWIFDDAALAGGAALTPPA